MIFRQFIFESMQRDPRFGSIYSRVQGRPSWTWKYAGLAAGLVVIGPIVLLILAGLFTFLAVFTLLSFAHRIGTWFGSLTAGRTTAADWPRDAQGRRGVRVVDAEFRTHD